jgi:hypothetical protein
VSVGIFGSRRAWHADIHELPNSFDQVNRVHCFNHTLHLSAKALLKAFSSTTNDSNDDSGTLDYDVGEPMLEEINDNNNEEEEAAEDEGDNVDDKEGVTSWMH